MEMRPRRSMAAVSQALKERGEFRRRSTLPRRELVRRHEERREIRLSLNHREEPRRLRMRPLTWAHSANEDGILERPHPQWADGIPFSLADLDEPFALSIGYEGQRGRQAAFDDPHDPEEVFRREG